MTVEIIILVLDISQDEVKVVNGHKECPICPVVVEARSGTEEDSVVRKKQNSREGNSRVPSACRLGALSIASWSGDMHTWFSYERL